MTRKRVSRRVLIFGGLCATATLTYAGLVVRGAARGCRANAMLERLAALHRIGNRLAGRAPSDAGRMVAAQTALPQAERLALTDMEASARRDFEAGRTVMVDGWVIARSEARTCLEVSARS